MIDIHCHMLPGLDDGPSGIADALAMARLAVEDGVTTVVATPHAFDGWYETARAAAEAAFGALRAAIAAEGIALDLRLGAECHLDERIFDAARRGDLLTVESGRYILLELPHEFVPPRLEESLFRLRALGLTPILAHPERNAELAAPGGIERVARWVAEGLLVQVTGASLTGEFGRRVKAAATALVERKLCHFVASDGHSATWRPPVLSAAWDEVEGLAGAEVALRLFVENPARALASEPIEAVAAPPRRRRKPRS